jgi:hypothetical protein
MAGASLHPILPSIKARVSALCHYGEPYLILRLFCCRALTLSRGQIVCRPSYWSASDILFRYIPRALGRQRVGWTCTGCQVIEDA